MEEQYDRLPNESEIQRLPKWYQVAFAARCARRVTPLFVKQNPHPPQPSIEAIERCITLSERSCMEGNADESLLSASMIEASQIAHSAKSYCALHAAHSVSAAASAAGAVVTSASDPSSALIAHHAARAAFDAISSAIAEMQEGVTQEGAAPDKGKNMYDRALLGIIEAMQQDYRTLLNLSEGLESTSDTPVPSSFITDSLWPIGEPEGWPFSTTSVATLHEAEANNALSENDLGKPSEPRVFPPKQSIHPSVISDSKADKDSLGYAPYIRAMTFFLLSESTKPPLTVSVEGEWGSGKSTFLNLLEKEIKEQVKPPRRIFAVNFSPWRHDKEESLWAAFVLTFLKQVGRQREWYERPISYARLFWGRLNKQGKWEVVRSLLMWSGIVVSIIGFGVVFYLKGGLLSLLDLISNKQLASTRAGNSWAKIVANITTFGAYIAGASALVKSFVERFGNPLELKLAQHARCPNYDNRIAFIEKLHEDFAEIIKAYTGNNRVYVFIDDLDRCAPPQAAELVQAIQLLMESQPNVIFILGMDRAKVAAGIAYKFKDLLPYLHPPLPKDQAHDDSSFMRNPSTEFGYSFLEKFIQLPFALPIPSRESLDGFLDSLLIPMHTGDQEFTTISAVNQNSKNGERGITHATTASEVVADSKGAEEPISSMKYEQEPKERVYDAATIMSRAEKEAREELQDEDRLSSFLDLFGDFMENPESEHIAFQGRVKRVAPFTKEWYNVIYRKAMSRLVSNTLTDLGIEGDSEIVRTVAKMAAKTLGYNPRKIKQFINQFRLAAYLARASGLLGAREDQYPTSLGALAKFVIIRMRWPELIDDIRCETIDNEMTEETLSSMFSVLSNLEQYANEGIRYDQLQGKAKEWARTPGLLSVFRYLPHGIEASSMDKYTYSFASLNVGGLLRISPLTGTIRKRSSSASEDLEDTRADSDPA